MERTAILSLLCDSGALVIQAHPYREAHYIDHIRLFPRHVHGIEIVNASRPDFENNMAAYYAQYYDLIPVAGSDNHSAEKQKRLAGLSFETPIRDEADFVARVMAREAKIFTLTPGA
jgi:predicted metal-dependent phosphoesterase TrpH